MRTLIFIATMLFSFLSGVNAQILEKDINMSLGVQTGNEVVLEGIQPKEAAQLWEDYFEDRYDGKIKKNRKANEYYATGVRINSIFTVSKIDVYTKFDERGDNTQMSIFVDLGMAFVNAADYPTEYKGVVDLTEDFRVHARSYAIGKEYEEAEKTLENMKKELDKLEKKNGRMHEKIADYEQKIIETKGEIEQNLIEQEDKRIDIDHQIEVLKKIQVRLESIKKN